MAWIYIINGANPAGIHLFGYAYFINSRDCFFAVDCGIVVIMELLKIDPGIMLKNRTPQILSISIFLFQQ